MPRHSVSPERQLVDATSDAAKDDGAADASVDPRGPLLVLAVTGNQLQPVLAGSFEAGAWTTTDIAAPNGLFSHGGGGITMTGADHGLVVLRGLSGIDDAGFYSAQWTAGVWPPLTR